jgi:hypothetical protein
MFSNLNREFIMSSTSEFKKTMSACSAIPSDKVQQLSMPVHVIAQEAQDLYEVALMDKEELVKVGMDEQLIDKLQKAGMFLRYTEAEWNNIRGNRAEAQRMWNEKSPEGFKLLHTILYNLRFALRYREDALARVRDIAEGGSNAGVLGKSYTRELQKIGFDLALLDTAEKTAAELTDLLAKANLNSSEENEHRELRDRAFTHLKTILSEIREYGKFIYHGDKKHMREYTSAYLRKINHSAKKARTAETEDLQEAA